MAINNTTSVTNIISPGINAAYDQWREGTNSSHNINDWSQTEFQNFMKWFMEVNYPEAVQQYQAIRDIERKIKAEEEAEFFRTQLKNAAQQYAFHQWHPAQNAYQAPPTVPITVSTEPKKQGLLESIFGWLG